jgi:hypothetical protein
MKKQYVFILLCACFSFMAHTSNAQKIGVGVRGGLNFSSTSGDLSTLTAGTTFNKESVTGYTFGAYGFFKFNPIFALQVEANFTQLGAKTTTTSTTQIGSMTFGSSSVSDVTFNYLQIPVLLRVEKGISNFRVWGNAGPYVGLSLGGKSKSISTTIGGFGGNQTFTSEDDIKSGDDIKSVDFGLMAGIGAGYKVGPGYITFDARYMLGLTRTPPDNVISTTFNPDDFKNRSIMLSLGYMFEF